MRLTDILQADCVKVPLESTEKQQVIYELVDLLVARTGISDADELKRAVWQREQTRTTGIGHGVGVPHGKCAGCERLSMAIGRPREPIDFGAIDGQPVDLIFLLASPPNQTGPHIQALATISRMLTDEALRVALRQEAAPEGLYQLIAQQETEAKF